jgi:class 3 adenylate cyclase
MAEPCRASTPLAIGTVTFLFSDIEGSTALREQDGARMSQALAPLDRLNTASRPSPHETY